MWKVECGIAVAVLRERLAERLFRKGKQQKPQHPLLYVEFFLIVLQSTDVSSFRSFLCGRSVRINSTEIRDLNSTFHIPPSTFFRSPIAHCEFLISNCPKGADYDHLRHHSRL